MLWIPIFCDAPGRFSITIAWPSNFDASGATMRATMSTGPPGAVGRTRRMGLVGKLCAWPAVAYARPHANAAKARKPTRSNVGGFVMDALPAPCDDSEDDEPFPHSIQLPLGAWRTILGSGSRDMPQRTLRFLESSWRNRHRFARHASLASVPGGTGDGLVRLRAGYVALAIRRSGSRSKTDFGGAKGGLVRAVHELCRERPADPGRPIRKEIRRQGQGLAVRVRESAATDARRSGGQAPRGRCDPLLRARDGDAVSRKNPAGGRLAVLG